MSPRPDPYREQRSTRHSLPHVSKHARDRAIEYFGRDFSPAEWAHVVAALMGGTAHLISMAERDGYGIYAVEVSGVALRFAWRPDRQFIATLLSPTGANHKAVKNDQGRRLKKKGSHQAANWRDGVRYPARIRWDSDVDTGRGPREAAIDTLEDEA